jgi:hypothetical protein
MDIASRLFLRNRIAVAQDGPPASHQQGKGRAPAPPQASFYHDFSLISVLASLPSTPFVARLQQMIATSGSECWEDATLAAQLVSVISAMA